jgi:hypothetical protein
MKITPSRRHQAGYVSVVLVLATGAILTMLTISAYRRAIASQTVQSQVQLRVDYSEKEEAILRSIVALTPNRAIRAMQAGSNTTGIKGPLRWRNIFTESLDLANARTSISSDLAASLNLTNAKSGNLGNSTLATPDRIFSQIAGVNDNQDTTYASSGINRSLGAGYPVPLTTSNPTTINLDRSYPLITRDKQYGSLAQSGVGLPVDTYPDFNLLPYPAINFGYAKPGEPFVAKRNWWAFSVDIADHDNDKTSLALSRRDFVLSIYEIPSQLSISASSYMALGQHASGEAWQNVQIDGGMFVGKAAVEGNTAINSLAIRRGMTMSSGTTIGGESFTASPFAPGVREAYQVTNGTFFPVSLASESGRAAFIPINRGASYFDRFDPLENDPVEASGVRNHYANNVLSPTTWNNYSIGAQQCAMRIDITQVQSSTNREPTMLRFQYLLTDGTRESMNMPLTSAVMTTLPPGYVAICSENESYTFSEPVDVAYGIAGGYTFRQGLTGKIDFNNDTFGDPKEGDIKQGYWRPRSPYDVKPGPGGQNCVTVYPERISPFLATIGAAGPDINNSLAVNVDYSVTGLNDATMKPSIPCTVNDYGVILRECADLTPFTKGFSLVTNLRLYIGDDFNTVPATPPAGYTPAVTASNPTGRFMPPCSLFTPEKRYGVDVDPFAVTLGGQIGSLAKADKVKDTDADAPVVRPLDSKNLSGNAIDADRITVNLSQIRHPAELPPITMMNWLILLEERRKEFH